MTLCHTSHAAHQRDLKLHDMFIPKLLMNSVTNDYIVHSNDADRINTINSRHGPYGSSFASKTTANFMTDRLNFSKSEKVGK